MNSNQCYFAEGSLVTIKDISSEQEHKGEIVANYGTYLVINPEQYTHINPGQQVTVGIIQSNKPLVFDSYICFQDQKLNKQFCIYVPSNLDQKKKRKYLRLAIELTMVYRIDGQEICTKTINISAGGMYFFTPRSLVSGQDIELDLFLPENTITIGARVLRTMQNAASVEFHEEMEKIHLLAAYLYRQSLLKRIEEETP
ncbi:hypothetical protein JCM14036_15420 [Desulfotomaculum defluvii]